MITHSRRDSVRGQNDAEASLHAEAGMAEMSKTFREQGSEIYLETKMTAAEQLKDSNKALG